MDSVWILKAKGEMVSLRPGDTSVEDIAAELRTIYMESDDVTEPEIWALLMKVTRASDTATVLKHIGMSGQDYDRRFKL